MSKSISILGCGWLGIPLAESWIADGKSVCGSTTSTEKIDLLESKKINAYSVNLEDEQTDLSEFLSSDILIISVTCKNLNAFQRLIGKIRNSSLKRVLYISSTSVYDFANASVNEETPTNQSPIAQIERLFLKETSFKTTILRFAGLFGPNRIPGNFIKTGIIKNPDGFINLIHQDDCIDIIRQIVEQDIFGEVFNACADDHPKRSDFYIKEVTKLGKAKPQLDDTQPSKFKIIDNQKLKSMLNYQFRINDLMNI